MYIVMTISELQLYAGLSLDVMDRLYWDPRDLLPENTGISDAELDKFEVCVPEAVAREFGIISERGERWISRFLNLPDDYAIPQAKAPERTLPTKEEPVPKELFPLVIVPKRSDIAETS